MVYKIYALLYYETKNKGNDEKRKINWVFNEMGGY